MAKKKKLGIDDLLDALKNPAPVDPSKRSTLENSKETWRRIGEEDKSLATDLGIEDSELTSFLKEWIEDNPYTNI